jgi:hypothetical protein
MTQDSTEERHRKHMAVMDDKRKIEALLPDDLYDSKDWRQGDMAERVLWLIAMLESKSEEVDAWVKIANKNVTKLAKLDKAVEDAFCEGFAEGYDGDWVEGDYTHAWKESEALDNLERMK